MFVGREEVIARLERSISSELNTLILGSRGSGKTSLLRHAMLRDRERSPQEDASRQLVYVDGTPAADVVDLVALIRAELQAERNVADVMQVGFSRMVKPRSRTDASAVVLEHLRELADVAPATILLDGVPQADHAHLLFGRLRDEVWQLPFNWVLAADVRDRAAMLRPPADAFWEVELRLQDLNEEEAAALVEARVGDRSLARALAQKGPKNPRRLISVTREAVLAGRDPDRLAEREMERELRLQELGQRPYELFTELLDLDRPVSASDGDLLARVGWSRPYVSRVLDQLEEAGFVESFTGLAEGQGRPPRLFRVITGGSS